MVRNYKRKTNQGSTSETVAAASKFVDDGGKIKEAVASYGVARRTLMRYRAKNADDRAQHAGYQQCSLSKMILPPAMEQELAKHIRDLDDRFHGLNPVKCRELAYEYANKNKESGINMPPSWRENKIAGELQIIAGSQTYIKTLIYTIVANRPRSMTVIL